MASAASSVIAHPATARADERVGRLTSSASLPILRLAHSFISSLHFLQPSAGIAWRRSSNSESREPTCPDMNTCPIAKSLQSACGCRKTSHSLPKANKAHTKQEKNHEDYRQIHSCRALLVLAPVAFAQHPTFTITPDSSQVAFALGGSGHH